MLAIDVVPYLNVAQVDAIGSVLGGLGFFVGAAALAVQLKSSRKAKKDDEARQARLVFARAASDQSAITGPTPQVLLNKRSVLSARVFNYSAEPIHLLDVTVDECETTHHDLIPPTGKAPIVMPCGKVAGYWLERHAETDIRITFTDWGGRRWERVGVAEPRRLYGS